YQHDEALFHPVQRHHGACSIQDPEWDEIQDVEPCACARQRQPDGIGGLQPDDGTCSRRQKTCQRSREAHRRTSCLRHAHGLPAHVSAKSREKHRHFSRKATPLDFNKMPKLMNEDENAETNAETRSPSRPVEANEGRKTEQKLQFEDGKYKCLGFGQNHRQRSQRRQAFCPPALFARLLWTMRICGSQLQLTQVLADPFRLLRFRRQQRQDRLPLLVGCLKVAARFQGACAGCSAFHFLRMDQALAGRTSQCSRLQCVGATLTDLIQFSGKSRHGFSDLSLFLVSIVYAEAPLASWNGPSTLRLPRPAVIFQAKRMPTNNMIKPMNPAPPSANSRNGEARPIIVSVPMAPATVIFFAGTALALDPFSCEASPTELSCAGAKLSLGDTCDCALGRWRAWSFM